jgi:hypothetical protein
MDYHSFCSALPATHRQTDTRLKFSFSNLLILPCPNLVRSILSRVQTLQTLICLRTLRSRPLRTDTYIFHLSRKFDSSAFSLSHLIISFTSKALVCSLFSFIPTQFVAVLPVVHSSAILVHLSLFVLFTQFFLSFSHSSKVTLLFTLVSNVFRQTVVNHHSYSTLQLCSNVKLFDRFDFRIFVSNPCESLFNLNSAQVSLRRTDERRIFVTLAALLTEQSVALRRIRSMNDRERRMGFKLRRSSHFQLLFHDTRFAVTPLLSSFQLCLSTSLPHKHHE